MQLSLLTHQASFISDTTTRYVALIGGYGCGKTKALAYKLVILCMLNPGNEGIALSPIYQMAHKVLIPGIEAALEEFGFQYKFNKTDSLFTIRLPGGAVSKLHILAAETFKRAAGINAAFFGIDEADLMETGTFIAAMQMLSSRLRKGKVYQGVVVSTPEGFKGCYKFFVEDIAKNPELATDRRIIQASTYDNPFLDDKYIASLEASYPENLITAYLNGQFVNLAGVPVYHRYRPAYDEIDPTTGLIITGNWTRKTIDSFPDVPLHIGLDFGRGNNPCEVNVINNGFRYAVDELYGLRNTDECIAELRKRYRGRDMHFYPDALNLEAVHNYEKHFGSDRVHYDPSNPKVGLRVAALHWSIQDPLTKTRHLLVNPEKCPYLDRGLQQQVLDKWGEPDKSAGVEHGPDAEGYLHYQRFPVLDSTFESHALRM